MTEIKHEPNPIFLRDRPTVEGPEGIRRTTIAFNDQLMLCHFEMKAGAAIPLHNHPAAQNGYVVSGKIKFLTEDGEFIAEAGTGYVFDPYERHGAEVLSDAQVIECFAPKRPEYEPGG